MLKTDKELVNAYTYAFDQYDKTRFVPMVESFLRSKLIEILEIREGIRVLDLAIGTSSAAILLTELNAFIKTVDLTEAND